MQDWVNKRIEVYFRVDAPKLEGTVKAVCGEGVTLETGDDGTALSHKVVATFVPFVAVRHINLLEARSEEEQERKRHELEERFRRMTMEQLAAPSQKQIEMLEKEDI